MQLLWFLGLFLHPCRQKGGCSKIITSVWQFLHNTATIWNTCKDIPKKVISFHHLCGFCFIQTRVVDAFVIKYVNGYYREAAEEERKADLSLSLRLSGIQNKNCIYSTFFMAKVWKYVSKKFLRMFIYIVWCYFPLK